VTLFAADLASKSRHVSGSEKSHREFAYLWSQLMIITFEVAEPVAQRATNAAQQLGKSLDEALYDYLERLAESNRRDDQWAQFEARCLNSSAQLNGQHFNRIEANER
jgi:hypothetical protein